MFFVSSFSLFSQHVGVNTLNPSSSLHVVPHTPGADPLTVEGVNIYTTETDFYVVDRTTGVVKYMPLDSLLTMIPSSGGADTDIDSLYYVGDTLYIRENGSTLKTEIPQSVPTSGTIGGYDTTEYLTGQTWIDGSPVYGRVIEYYGATPSIDLSPFFTPNYIDNLLDFKIRSYCSGNSNFSSYRNFSYTVSTNTISSYGNNGFVNCTFSDPYILIMEYTKQ